MGLIGRRYLFFFFLQNFCNKYVIDSAMITLLNIVAPMREFFRKAAAASAP